MTESDANEAQAAFLKKLNVNRKSNKSHRSPSFYEEYLDDRVGPVLPGKLVTIHGAQDCGKTTYALNLLYLNVFYGGLGGCFVSFQMDQSDILKRLYARHSLNWKFRHRGVLTLDDLKGESLPLGKSRLAHDVVKDVTEMHERNLWILSRQTLARADCTSIREELYRIEAKRPDQLGFIVVDCLQLMDGGNASTQTFRHKKQILLDFKDLAVTFAGRGIAIFLVCLLTGKAEAGARRHGRYYLSSFVKSPELQHSDACLFLYSDEDTRRTNEMVWQLLKNRGGEVLEKPIPIRFDPSCVDAGKYPGSSFTDEERDEMINELIDDHDRPGRDFGPPRRRKL
jgi:replicative DNA helicase